MTITTREKRYTPSIRSEGGTLRYGEMDIGVTLANGSRRTVYPEGCMFSLERQQDATWVPVFSPTCVSAVLPERIRPGQSATARVRIIEYARGGLSTFRFPYRPTTYRVVFDLRETPWRAGQEPGTLLPVGERASAPFVIAPS